MERNNIIEYYIKRFKLNNNKNKIMKNKIMSTGRTAHNRSVYASPPMAARGSGRLGHGLTPIPTPPSTHIFAALVFAAQSPYPGRKNVANSRNVMCNSP